MNRFLERLLRQGRLLWTGLQIADSVAAALVPFGLWYTALGKPLAVTGFVGLAVGWKWGQAESIPRDIRGKIKGACRILAVSFTGFLVLCLLPQWLGLIAPVIYESAILFELIIWAPAVCWGVTVFTFMRLFVVLSRRASERHR
jgi:hypothetical protein